MHHRRVACADDGSYVLQIDPLPFRKRYDKIIHIVHDAVLHLIKGIVFFGVDDSADIVFAEAYLAVIRGLSSIVAALAKSIRCATTVVVPKSTATAKFVLR